MLIAKSLKFALIFALSLVLVLPATAAQTSPPEPPCTALYLDELPEDQLQSETDHYERAAEERQSIWRALWEFVWKKDLQKKLKVKLGLKPNANLKKWLARQSTLRLSGLNLNEKEFAFILNHINGESIEDVDLSTNFLIGNRQVTELIAKTPNLKVLNLNLTNCNGGLLDELYEYVPGIRNLSIDHIRASHLNKLLKFHDLRVLDISNTSITRFFTWKFYSFIPSFSFAQIKNFIHQARLQKKPMCKKLHKLVLPNFGSREGRVFVNSTNHLVKPAFKIRFSQAFKEIDFSGDPKDIYDGDTLKVDIPTLSAFDGLDRTIRLDGIDAAEMKPNEKDIGFRTKSDLRYEKRAAKAAKNFLTHYKLKAGNENTRYMNVSKGKFRLLADVQVKVPTNFVIFNASRGKAGYRWMSLSAEMVRLGLALPYDGTTKEIHKNNGFTWRKHIEKHQETYDYWFKMEPKK